MKMVDRIERLEGRRSERRIVVVHFGREADAAERLAALKREGDPNLTILVVRYVSGGAGAERVQP